MRLSEVQFQVGAHDRLQRALSSGRMPHAYLFSGPEGTGKEMMASRLAAVLLCESPVTGRPPKHLDLTLDEWRDACGSCVDCELMAAGNHPDYHRIYRTLNKVHPDKEVQRRKATELGIDVIRHFFIEKAGLRPSRGRAKVFVIAEGDRLNPNSQNAMLKTLEEPPEQSYIIVLSASGDLLLDTTRSRCHQISFRGLPTEFIVSLLSEKHGADATAARFLAELSQGSAGRAIHYLNLGLQEHAVEVVESLRRAESDPLGFGTSLFELAKKLSLKIRAEGRSKDDEDDDDTADLNVSRLGQSISLALAGAILRDIQRVALGVPAAAMGGSPALKSLGLVCDRTMLRGAIKALSTAEYQIVRNAQAQLVFDVVGIETAKIFSTAAAAR